MGNKYLTDFLREHETRTSTPAQLILIHPNGRIIKVGEFERRELNVVPLKTRDKPLEEDLELIKGSYRNFKELTEKVKKLNAPFDFDTYLKREYNIIYERLKEHLTHNWNPSEYLCSNLKIGGEREIKIGEREKVWQMVFEFFKEKVIQHFKHPLEAFPLPAEVRKSGIYLMEYRWEDVDIGGSVINTYPKKIVAEIKYKFL